SSLGLGPALPFFFEQTKHIEIPTLCVALERFTPAYFLDKSKLLQQGDGSHVVLRDNGTDTKEVQFGERKSQQHAQGLCIIAFATILRRSDAKPQKTVAV